MYKRQAQEEFDFIVAADARAGVGVSTSYAEMLRNYERRREERPAHSDSEDSLPPLQRRNHLRPPLKRRRPNMHSPATRRVCIDEEDLRAPLPRRRSPIRLRPARSRSPHRDSPEPLDEDPPQDGDNNESAAPESRWPSGNPLDDMETNVSIPDEFNIDNFSDPEYLHEYAAGRRTIRRCWKNFKTLLPPLSYVSNDEIRRAHNDRSHAGVPFMWRIALREWNYRMHSIGARLSAAAIGYTWYD